MCDKEYEIGKRLELHNNFWNRVDTQRPLVSFRIGEYFFSRHFKESRRLLRSGKKITPDMLHVEAFIDDYERMYTEILSIGQDGFWVAEPFTGIPWMEGILGCNIYATESSYVSSPWLKKLDEIDKIRFDYENKWFKKYMEFLVKLKKISKSRFPIGQPILRGPSDMAGAIMGQTELVYALHDNPKKMKTLFNKVTDIFLKLISEHYKVISDFHGGYSLGFYHVWAPGKCIWYQEDLSALLSPVYYCNFLKECNEKICEDYKYTAMHIHPASFFLIDELMKIDNLKVIQVNKDIGGPSIKEMMPHLKKIINSKRLIIWGDLDFYDLDIILHELPSKGLYLTILAETIEEAERIFKYIK
jgi:hypothetical protein